MAPWSHIVASNPQVDQLCNYTLFILTIAALTEGRSETNSSSPLLSRGHDSKLIFEHFQQSLLRIVSHVSNVTRQNLMRTLAGQIGLWDIIHLVMACGLFQVIRIWKRRREAHQDSFVPSNGSVVGGQHGRKNTRTSLDDNGVSRKGEYQYLVQCS
jgi:hypothetical protein